MLSGCVEEENFSTAGRIAYDGVTENTSFVENVKKSNQDITEDCPLYNDDEILSSDGYNCFHKFMFDNARFIRIEDIVGYEDINLDDIMSNPNLSGQQNERIKRILVNTILYLYDFEVDFNIILSAIDEEASEHWLITKRPHWISQDESWNILDEINLERDFNREFSRLLYGFYATFMMVSEVCEDNRFLDIIVTFYQVCGISGQESGYLRYYFTFEKIEGIHKLIGLAAGA